MNSKLRRRLWWLGLGTVVVSGALVGLALRAPVSLVGQLAPDFSLPDQDGTATHLADARGKWVVLVFYPKDSSRACTLQNKALTEHQDAFEKRNALAWAISTGDLASKRDFCKSNHFTHRLLSDPQGAVTRDYRVALPLPGVTLANRVTVIIDPEGRIAAVDNVVNPSTGDATTLAQLDQLIHRVK